MDKIKPENCSQDCVGDVCEGCDKFTPVKAEQKPGLREKIAEKYSNSLGLDFYTPPGRKLGYIFAKQIITLVKEAGYVKLADDQSKPKVLLNQESKEDWFRAYGIMDVLNAWRECYSALYSAGWRKVEGM